MRVSTNTVPTLLGALVLAAVLVLTGIPAADSARAQQPNEEGTMFDTELEPDTDTAGAAEPDPGTTVVPDPGDTGVIEADTLVVADTVPVAPEPLTEIPWEPSLDAALTHASDSSKHVIVDYYTDWCKWCKVMEDSTFTDSNVILSSERFVFVRINAEIDTARARAFGVNGYPTIVLLDKTGNEVDRVQGYYPPAEFLKVMDGYLKGVGTLWELEQQLAEKRNDPEVMYKIAQKYIGRGLLDKARQTLGQVRNVDNKNSSGFVDNAEFDLAILLRKDKKWYKAIEAFKQLSKDYPESEMLEDAAVYVPWCYVQAGDNKEALKRYRQFREDFSGSSESDWVKDQIERLESLAEAEESSE